MAKQRIYSINSRIKNYFATSLEQLLISVLISSIIILILFQVYSLVKKQLLKIEQQITILYNQNVADFFLRDNIRKAGYKGFVSSIPFPHYSSVYTASGHQVVPYAPIAVCKATVANCTNFVTDKVLRKIIDHKIKSNTDILLVYDIPERVTFLTEDMLENDSKLRLALLDNAWQAGDQMIIADLKCIQRFVLSNFVGTQLAHDKPYNITNNFIKKFKRGAEVFRVKHLAFYIAKNTNYKSDSYSLYMDDLSLDTNHHAEAIVDDLENLSVQVLGSELSSELMDASDLGWIFNKYLLINLLFKNQLIEQNFTVGIEVRNSG